MVNVNWSRGGQGLLTGMTGKLVKGALERFPHYSFSRLEWVGSKRTTFPDLLCVQPFQGTGQSEHKAMMPSKKAQDFHTPRQPIGSLDPIKVTSWKLDLLEVKPQALISESPAWRAKKCWEKPLFTASRTGGSRVKLWFPRPDPHLTSI